MHRILQWTALVVSASSAGCEGILGLSEFHAQRGGDASVTSETRCRTSEQCPSAGDDPTATRCSKQHTCGALRSEDCTLVTGPEDDRHALVIGSLFASTGPEAASDRARQNSVVLAVEEINAAGGVPAPAGADARHLLLVSCDPGSDALRAAGHLIDVNALAIVGPETTQTMLDISQKLSIAAGTLLVSPIGLTDSIDDLSDDDLDWLMAPTVEQRAPLLNAALAELEQELAAERATPLKLAVLFRDDAVGHATMTALQQYRFEGATLAQAGMNDDRVRVELYDPDATDRGALLASYQAFAPDILVLIGMSEAVSDIMVPLERTWDSDAPRPHYVLTEASKVPALLALTQQSADLRGRVRGIGVTPTVQSRPVYESFQNRYDARFGDGLSSASGAAGAYDASYAIAYALARVEAQQETGARVGQALRWLSGSDAFISVGTVGMSTAFQKLAAGESIAALGTMSPLRWDDRGATQAGAVEVWCIGASDDGMRFASAGMTLDVATLAVAGTWSACSSTIAIRTQPQHASPEPASQHAPSDSTPAAKPAPDPSAAAGHRADAGHGGAGAAAAQAGAGGQGGRPPQPSAAGADAAAPTRSTVACGANSCQLGDGEHCCVSALRPYTGPRPEDVNCGSTQDSCELSLYCASDLECAPGAVCCSADLSALCMDPAQCNSLSGRRLGCESDRDCADPTVCCIHITADATTFTRTACEEQCSAVSGGGRLCETDADCADVGLNLVCNTSWVLPNIKVCWPDN